MTFKEVNIGERFIFRGKEREKVSDKNISERLNKKDDRKIYFNARAGKERFSFIPSCQVEVL